MLKSLRWLPLLIPAFAAAAWAAPVRAAEQQATLIGVLDTKKMSEGAEPIKKAYADLNVFQDRLTNNLQALEDAQFLDENEFKEFTNILDTPQMSTSGAARLQALKDMSLQRQKEWLQITSNPNATEEQKKKAEQYDKTRMARLEAAKTLKNSYQKSLNDKAQEILPALSKKVDGVVESIAKEKKLYIVLSKKQSQGDDDIVLWGGIDVTDDVIKALNKLK